ncbi:TWiK family of potassium channels protein 7-like [Mytilus edulis]|uniref:TWiK family of potassium channels protein 7-like n=1 Tax=Mytilus edulis TaxID=6550 RepID=UPI0039F1339A
MACEFKLNPERVLHIAKSFPFVVFTLCVYILIGAAIYLRIGDTYEVYKEHGDLEVNSSLSSNNTSGNEFPIQYEDEDTNPWHYWESLFFIVTTLTTIGYGHITPTTAGGKIFVMVYSSVGIPLTMVVIAGIGKRLAAFVSFIYLTVRNRLQSPNLRYGHVTQKGDSINLNLDTENVETGSNMRIEQIENHCSLIPFLASVAILFVYILIGGAIYSSWEHVTYMDAVYLVFISLSTIGFGDIIPPDDKYNIGSCIYLPIGLILVSMCVNAALQYSNMRPHTERKGNIERAEIL